MTFGTCERKYVPPAFTLILCYDVINLMGNLVKHAGQGINVFIFIISTVAVMLVAAHIENP